MIQAGQKIEWAQVLLFFLFSKCRLHRTTHLRRREVSMKTIQRMTMCLAIICLVAIVAPQRADDPQPEQGVDVLTRGPLHEAYASAVTPQPEAGALVPKAPPAAIEELPPDQKPEGDNVQWMPGYWSWDEERQDFIWVSGFWRVPPPGRQWVPGTWHEANSQWQYTSGFWTELNQPDMNYLPPPPKPIDAGPPTPAPAADYQYAPGSWVYRETRYVWRPGFWYPHRANWIYIPAHYSWTPYGYVFVDGYWDYPLRQRGVLFAPVAFNAAVYSQPAFVYRPQYVVYDDFLYGALFVRPGAGYYFGDYFEPRYANLGYRSWYTVQIGRGAYDPLYGYYRTSYGPGWATGINNLYVQRVNNVAYRPPRTLAQQTTIVNNINNTVVNNNTTVVNNVKNVTAVAPITNVNKTQIVNLTQVTPQQQQAAVQHAREIRQVAVERAKIEAPAVTAPGTGGIKPAPISQPRTVKLELPKPPPGPPPSAPAPPPLPIKAEKLPVAQQPNWSGDAPPIPKPGDKPPTTTTPPRPGNNPPPPPPKTDKPAPQPPPTNPPPAPKPGDRPPPPKTDNPPPAPRPGNNPPPPPPKADKPPPPPPSNNPPPPKADKPPAPPANNPPPPQRNNPPPPPKADKPPPSPPPANNPPPPQRNNPPPPPPKADKPPPPPPKSPPPPPPKSDRPPPKDKDKDKPPRQ
jgi:hypothetical protein